jgi:hypothetical protein
MMMFCSAVAEELLPRERRRDHSHDDATEIPKSEKSRLKRDSACVSTLTIRLTVKWRPLCSYGYC